MKISIVMATYNGEKFIKKQLESFLEQSTQADEVIITDDQSTDNTKSICLDFIRDNHLENKWFFYENSSSLRCAKNFLHGVEIATGDIIFFSDQDDIWDPQKIEYMSNGFNLYKDMLACYCLEEYIDSNDNVIKSHFQFTHNVHAGNELYKKVSFAENIKYNKCPGLCLAFKKTFFEDVKGMIVENNLMHDLSIGNVAALKDGFYVVNKKLVNYRQHTNNLSAPRITVKKRIADLDFQIKGRKKRLEQLLALEKFYGKSIKKEEKDIFEECIKYTADSIVYLENKNLGLLFLQLFIRNKMINKWIALNNFMCVLYSKFR